jgi:16S rRNA (uracil1498-N3)-methyltransferase
LAAENYKRLIRLYLPESEFSSGEKCFLSDGQAHYLRSVMRKSAGDELRVFNGHDGEWLAVIEELNKKNVLIKLDRQLLEQQKGSDIWVLASPVKKEALDLMVEKACELGAAKFIPVMCDHTVVHKINQERLQMIAVEAAEQSERLDVMTVESPLNLKKYLNSGDCNRDLIFCVERTGAASLAEVGRKLSGKPLAILIGPEGGFSYQEIDFISNFKHAHPVSLGPRILKTETALIAALSCVQILS